jgi:hypothetical protein
MAGISVKHSPIPLPASPLKGEEQVFSLPFKGRVGEGMGDKCGMFHDQGW